jgi:hypothetical protein
MARPLWPQMKETGEARDIKMSQTFNNVALKPLMLKVRVTPEWMVILDHWRDTQSPKPSRSAAVRLAVATLYEVHGELMRVPMTRDGKIDLGAKIRPLK